MSDEDKDPHRVSGSDPRSGKILELVSERPGLTISEIAEALEIDEQTVQAHLVTFVEQGDVDRVREGPYEIYLPADLDQATRDSIAALRKPRVRDVALRLFRDPFVESASALSDELGITTREVRNALQELQERGLAQVASKESSETVPLHPRMRVVIARWFIHEDE